MSNRSTYSYLLFACCLTAVAACSAASSAPSSSSPSPSSADAASDDGATAIDAGLDDAPPVDSGGTRSDASTDAADAAPQKRVFVTSQAFHGDLKTAGNGADGLDGADSLCAAAATAASLGGTWKAYLSGVVNIATVHAPDRIADVAPWHLLDGTLAVASKDQLSTSIAHSIDVDETGQKGVRAVWTGTRLGRYTQGCDGVGPGSWSSSNDTASATAGSTASDAKYWSADTSTFGEPNALAYCNDEAHLYCFEQ